MPVFSNVVIDIKTIPYKVIFSAYDISMMVFRHCFLAARIILGMSFAKQYDNTV